MRTRPLLLLALMAGVGFDARPGQAEEPKDKPKEQALLIKNAEGFVEAFHKGDAKAVAAFWTEAATYVDEAGREHKGRPAIEKMYAKLFADNKGAHI